MGLKRANNLGTCPGHLPFEGATVREVVMKTLWGKACFHEEQWAAISEVHVVVCRRSKNCVLRVILAFVEALYENAIVICSAGVLRRRTGGFPILADTGV